MIIYFQTNDLSTSPHRSFNDRLGLSLSPSVSSESVTTSTTSLTPSRVTSFRDFPLKAIRLRRAKTHSFLIDLDFKCSKNQVYLRLASGAYPLPLKDEGVDHRDVNSLYLAASTNGLDDSIK